MAERLPLSSKPTERHDQEAWLSDRSPVLVSLPNGKEEGGFIIRETGPGWFVIHIPWNQEQQGRRVKVRRELLQPGLRGGRLLTQQTWEIERAALFGPRKLPQTPSLEEAPDTTAGSYDPYAHPRTAPRCTICRSRTHETAAHSTSSPRAFPAAGRR